MRRLFVQWTGLVWLVIPTAGANNQSLSAFGGPQYLTKDKGLKLMIIIINDICWLSCCGSVFAQNDHVWPSYGGDRVYPSSFDRDVYLSSTDNPVFRTHPSSLWYIHQAWAKRREILVNMNLQTHFRLSPACCRHHEPHFNYFSRLHGPAHHVPDVVWIIRRQGSHV